MMLYTDDYVMLYDDSDMQRFTNKTENDFYKIEEWTKTNKISLNYSKTKCVFFSLSKFALKNFAINTTNGPFLNSNVIKYFGVLLIVS